MIASGPITSWEIDGVIKILFAKSWFFKGLGRIFADQILWLDFYYFFIPQSSVLVFFPALLRYN